MDNLRAAILRPQLGQIDANRERWNAHYRAVERELANVPGIRLPQRRQEETYVGSSIQFLLTDFASGSIVDFLRRCKERGVEIKWFGADRPVGYTSRHQSWRYLDPQSLPETDRILDRLCDMRLPLTFTVEDCRLIGGIIRDCALATRAAVAAGEISGDTTDFALEAT
jgi:dTDP-4-amino-4,6-dideoxygalactose transaminase